jgi:hypothetical protein
VVAVTDEENQIRALREKVDRLGRLYQEMAHDLQRHLDDHAKGVLK